MSRLSRPTWGSSFLALATAAVLIITLTTVAQTANGVTAPGKAPAAAGSPLAGPSASVSATADDRAALKLVKGTKKALKTLVKQTGKVKKSAIKAKSRKLRAKMVANAAGAKRNAPDASCKALKQMTKYRKAAKGVKAKGPRKRKARTLDRLASLSAQSTNISLLLLGSKQTKKCGGGVAISNRTEADTKVLESDEDNIKLQVKLPKVIMGSEQGNGKTFVKLLAPDTVNPGEPGQPGIPMVSEMFGVPDGAKVTVDVKSSKSVEIDGVQLYPTQPEPVDDVTPPDFDGPPFSQPAFVKEDKIDGTFPKKPASASLLGTARDVLIGKTGLATGQYTPKNDTLKIFTSLVINIKFLGGTGFFGNACSPWELSASRLIGGLINAQVIRPHCVFTPFRCGEELMVITNPLTLSEATTYADERTLDGFRTRIFQTGPTTGVGTTAAQIQTFIRSHVNSANCIRPSYVAIIGDDEYVPTFTNGPGGIPSDNPYSTANNTDELPDIAVGRILGNTTTELQNFITKINYYQNNTLSSSMRRSATIAAQFQDTDADGEVNDGQEDRTFIQFAETARTGLVRRRVAVDRIYDDSPNTSPTHFNDGTPLPGSLQKPTFPWDGDGADVTAAWNAGRFLMVHRDHGWSDGWGHPSFTTTDVNALTNTNDELPVVMSINCSSAQYDLDETSFVQQSLVKATGGAVAAFGDTRDSPSWHNTQIGLGFLDGLLPHVLSGEGPASQMRVGDALTHGKLRLAGLAPPSGPGIVGGSGSTRNELYLWHLFGDPTMRMQGGTDQLLILNPRQFAVEYIQNPNPGPGDPPYFVNVQLPQTFLGQPFSLVTLNADGHPEDTVGKAIGDGDLDVTIPAQFTDDDSRLAVVLNADNAVPLQLEVDLPPT